MDTTDELDQQHTVNISYHTIFTTEMPPQKWHNPNHISSGLQHSQIWPLTAEKSMHGGAQQSNAIERSSIIQKAIPLGNEILGPDCTHLPGDSMQLQ